MKANVFVDTTRIAEVQISKVGNLRGVRIPITTSIEIESSAGGDVVILYSNSTELIHVLQRVLEIFK